MSLETTWTFVTSDDRAAPLRDGIVALADGVSNRSCHPVSDDPGPDDTPWEPCDAG